MIASNSVGRNLSDSEIRNDAFVETFVVGKHLRQLIDADHGSIRRGMSTSTPPPAASIENARRAV